MLFLYLFIIQFVASNGNLMCMYSKYPKCWESFVGQFNGNYCSDQKRLLAILIVFVFGLFCLLESGSEQTIECMKDKATQCYVQNSSLVLGLEQGLKEMCQDGTQFNEAYLKHKACVFGSPAEPIEECYFDVTFALQNYPLTGYRDEDELGMFKLTCRYDDQVNLCLSKHVLDTCGEEADSFYHKFQLPANKLITAACMESSAATFNFIRTLLLQASATLFALTFFKLTV